MNQVGTISFSAAELEVLVLGVRRAAHGFVTNFFFPTSQYDIWIKRGLYVVASEKTSLLLALPEERCIRLFFAGSEADLPLQLGAIGMEKQLPWVVDIVGRAGSTQGMKQMFANAGFRPHLRLVRLSRMGPYNFPSSESAESLCRRAEPTDVPRLQQLLTDYFDPFADRLPGVMEITSSIEAGNIRIACENGNLAGFVWYEDSGATCHVRYWGVSGEFQKRGFGGLLMREYFRLTRDCHRHLLWVREDNAQACSCYAHYGYQPDGLEDQIMVRDK